MDVLTAAGVVVDTQKIHACACGYRTTADRMFNPNRKYTEGKLVVFCGVCAKRAHREGVFLYRLSSTLTMDARRRVREFGQTSILASILKKQREEKERSDKTEPKRQPATPSRSLLSPTINLTLRQDILQTRDINRQEVAIDQEKLPQLS